MALMKSDADAPVVVDAGSIGFEPDVAVPPPRSFPV